MGLGSYIEFGLLGGPCLSTESEPCSAGGEMGSSIATPCRRSFDLRTSALPKTSRNMEDTPTPKYSATARYSLYRRLRVFGMSSPGYPGLITYFCSGQPLHGIRSRYTIPQGPPRSRSGLPTERSSFWYVSVLGDMYCSAFNLRVH